MEKSLHSLLLRIHHERSKATQLVELIDELSHRKTTLAKGDERFRQVIPLRRRNKLILEPEKESVPVEYFEIKPTSDSPPPVQGGTIQGRGRQTAPLNRREGYVLKIFLTPLDPS